jgi:DNA polymerase III alpha subunit
MINDEYGSVGYTENEIVESLRINPSLDFKNLFIIDGEKYQHAQSETFLDVPEIKLWEQRSYDLSSDKYHKELQKIWLMPDEYKNLDIEKWLYQQCNTQLQIDRVMDEVSLYIKFELLDLLKYLKYLRETASKNNIVWGVGRGSSCASYCLFLLGIHKVDSLKYNLNVRDFLREK